MTQVPSQHASRKHADLPPSSSDKWMNCFGWLASVREFVSLYGYPPSSEAAEEGTRAHEKLERHLLGFQPLRENDEEFDYLMPVVEHILEHSQKADLHLEVRVDFGDAYGYADLQGTSDVVVVSEDTIKIMDLKYGLGLVEVEKNPQLMIYLVGAIHKFGRRSSYEIWILQPRAWHKDGPFRSYTITDAELRVFEEELLFAIEGNYKNSPCNPGDHCNKYCMVLATCKARREQLKDRLRKQEIEE